MPKHLFLSDDWIAAAREIRARHESGAQATVQVRMNLVVEQVPFGDGRVEAHLDTSGGTLEIELGHLESPDVRVVLDYPTARAVLVDGDGQAALQAFMAGTIRVEGDLAKLLQYQSVPPGGAQAEVAEELRAITA
ncbi:MAG: hypothetical protein JWM85_1432 [Acidimicrobiaceae bacterium]|nr:hypothetical protein [Acidimicrobiaceae bacterium]